MKFLLFLFSSLPGAQTISHASQYALENSFSNLLLGPPCKPNWHVMDLLENYGTTPVSTKQSQVNFLHAGNL